MSQAVKCDIHTNHRILAANNHKFRQLPALSFVLFPVAERCSALTEDSTAEICPSLLVAGDGCGGSTLKGGPIMPDFCSIFLLVAGDECVGSTPGGPGGGLVMVEFCSIFLLVDGDG